MITTTDHLKQPVMTAARKDFATLQDGFSVQQALDDVRSRDIGEKIVYFYVVNDRGSLVGVVPTRRLLTASLDKRLSEVMIKRVITIPQEATVLDACELFAIHKLLAFPVVDEQRRIVGVVDVSIFTDEVFDMTERERMDEVFELIGFQVSSVRDASPFRAFRFRFIWLLATIFSGTICAFLVSAYETTLSRTIILAFFLTMVLGLGESVSIQSMTVTIQALRSRRATLQWYLRALGREVVAALLLGTGCGLVVGLIVCVWHGIGLPAIAIGTSVLTVLFGACLIGLSVPSLLHALKMDLKIAAGPVTLAATDIFTIVCYFGLGALLL